MPVRRYLVLVVATCFCIGPAPSFAQSPAAQSQPRESKRRLPPGFITKSIRIEDNGREYKYVLFVPPQYHADESHRWPLIVFLHGSGECGEDGIRQTTVGLPVYISMHTTQFPFLVLMPQAHSMWFRGTEALAVWKMMNVTRDQYRVDDDRIYLTGLSMGGFGAWEMAMAQPDVFAAIVPVCGVAGKEFLPNLTSMPIWAFHGARDTNVPVAGSRDAIKELRTLGGIWPKYTEYPDMAHECWDRAYGEPELWKWLRAQKRKTPRTIDYRIPGGAARVWWLAIQAKQGLKTPARIHAELADKGVVNVETEGVESWSLVSDREPIRPGTDVQVNWNGAVVYRGKFKGLLTFSPGKSEAPPSGGRQPENKSPRSQSPTAHSTKE